MIKALISCISISAIFILIASGFGISKIQDLVSYPWFVFICVIYFGMIFSTTGLLIYCIVKSIKVIKAAVVEIEKLGVKVQKVLEDLKVKLEKIPGFVWKLIFNTLGIKLPKK